MVDILHDSHDPFKEYEAEYPGVQKRIVNPPKQMEVEVSLQNDVADYNHSRTFRIRKVMSFDLVVNSTPTLSLTTPGGQTLQNDAGKSLLNVEGYVQDADNNDVTVSVEVPNVLYKKIIVPKAHNTKAFSIPIDVLEDAIPPGDYTVIVKAVDPSNASASASMSFKVRQRLKRSAFVLINSQIQNSTSYSDYEEMPNTRSVLNTSIIPIILTTVWACLQIPEPGGIRRMIPFHSPVTMSLPISPRIRQRRIIDSVNTVCGAVTTLRSFPSRYTASRLPYSLLN